MPQYSENPIILSILTEIPSLSESAFTDWQAHFNSQIVNFSGFISLEFLAPTKKEKHWQIVQRFSDQASASKWKHSNPYQELLKELSSLAPDGKIEEIQVDAASFEGVTEIIITEVSSDRVEDYRKWTAKIHQAEAKFAGFRGVYIQSPEENRGKHWITLLQFDTMENLDQWLNSSERKTLLNESAPFISSLEIHRVISPFAGWFASIAKVSEIPAVWKQTMIVLLVLFPIVMLEIKFLSPFTAGLNLSLATFIGNMISVSLIAFPLMPLAIGLLGWWLSPEGRNRRLYTILGTCLVIGLYLLEIMLFWGSS
ncbi:antibiotic biosynthesis monooxygenase [Parachlamydia acanthamoebae]|uniref:Uncharacterized protein Synpcc7942_2318 n=2 Tax=Parachlamydia acanthamoebae TaxID=83552 RepID=F8L1C5_PARAV|nr:hypothetical protein [Parachlamydia acanthamoebae]KIA77248.1 hypothetical protein DB43_GR00150 [Parachlamydia acanthamoebae]CCB87059.1 uncharacterized protein Synpcc7942_2318 [Parachlamydia acanthamoebae UV-7]